MEFQKRICKTSYSPILTEFRGTVPNPNSDLLPMAKPGDVYIDLQLCKIWYFATTWMEWHCLDRKKTHPIESSRFLNPTSTMFVWSSQGTFANARVHTQKDFGRDFSAADVVRKYHPQLCKSLLVGGMVEPTAPTKKSEKKYAQSPTTQAPLVSQSATQAPLVFQSPTPVLATQNPDFIAGLAGTQFPPELTPIEWTALGIRTYGPFMKSELGMLDLDVVNFLSKLPRAEELDEPLVAIIQQPESLESFHQSLDLSAEKRFIKEIRMNLARNVAVVVKGWYPQIKREFSVEGFKRVGRNVRQMVQFQHASSRVDVPHGESTLESFIKRGDEYTSCENVLDDPTFAGEAPSWLRHLRDSIAAMEVTARCNYTKDSGEHLGPKYGLFDMWRLLAWELHTHGGFLTYPHHDAGGFLTYVYPASGAKIWCFIRPKLGEFETRHNLFQRFDKLGSFTGYNAIKQMGTILLQPGDFLLQPPGLYHLVYTPVKGTTCGGHFFCYETMHLTEMSLAYDLSYDMDNDLRGTFATNAVHPDGPRYLARMVMALPYLAEDHTFHTCQIWALMAIIHHEHQKRKLQTPQDVVTAEINSEIKKAHDLVEHIRKGLSVQWKEIYSSVESLQSGWSEHGSIVNLSHILTSITPKN